MAVGKEFGADPNLIKLYQVYLAIGVIGGFLWWLLPVVIAVWLSFELWIGVTVALLTFGSLMIVVAFTLYWIPKFYSSLKYVLEDDKITVTKGIWWKKKSFVPYNRITNVNTIQGPISRKFGLGTLSIQTAGYSMASGGGGRVAEAEIFGVKNFEELKDVVMGFVKGMRPKAVEAGAEVPSEEVNQQILLELRRIRKSLEK